MASLAILSWPIVTLVLFSALGPVRGLIWATMAGYLFLPSGFGYRLPGIPDYNKLSAISFSLVLAAMIFGNRVPAASGRRSQGGIQTVMIGLVVVMVAGMALTMLDNRSSIRVLESVRPGLSPKDLVSMTSEALILFTPFFLALRWLNRPEHHRELIKAFTLLGLVYGALVIFEWRMSPQLNNWIYGYFPHAWFQHVRNGGFRAVVFLNHGLSVGFFLFSALLAALGSVYAAREGRVGMLAFAAAGWIAFSLLLSYNMGAVILAVLFGGTLLFAGSRLALWVATGGAVLFLGLPALRQSGLVTFQTVVDQIARIDANRANSLAFRIEQEGALLAHALRKPFFGWGGWGRGRGLGVDETGRTVADGLWIIHLGERGWVGYLTHFGLLALPLFVLPFVYRQRGADFATVALALIGAGNLVYLIPNSTLSPVGMLTFGALAGLVLYVRPVEAEGDTPSPQDDTRAPGAYTRFPHGPPAAAPARPTRPQHGRARAPRAFTRQE